MSDEKKLPEATNNNGGKKNVLVENLSVLATPEGFQKYMLGTKKNGSPRAVYDVVKDYAQPKKKKKKDKKKDKDKSTNNTYSFYLDSKKDKKKKKKKKKSKHWHI